MEDVDPRVGASAAGASPASACDGISSPKRYPPGRILASAIAQTPLFACRSTFRRGIALQDHAPLRLMRHTLVLFVAGTAARGPASGGLARDISAMSQRFAFERAMIALLFLRRLAKERALAS